MSGELAPLSTCLRRLGIEVDDPLAADVLFTLRVVSQEIRDYTHVPYEGVPTIYDEVIDIHDDEVFILPATPIADLLSLNAITEHGEEAIYTPEPVENGVSTTLAVAAIAGDTNVRLASTSGLVVGDHLLLGSAEVTRLTSVGTPGAGGTGCDVEPAITWGHALGTAAREVAGSLYWRLVDEARGQVELDVSPRFVRARWRTTGDVPTPIVDATVEWVTSRFGQRERTAGQSSYSTGQDSESWDISKAGQPPSDVARILGRYWMSGGGAVI